MLYNIFLDISQSNFLCSGTNKSDAVKMAAVSSSFHHENKIRLRHARSKLFITKKKEHTSAYSFFLLFSINQLLNLYSAICTFVTRSSLKRHLFL